MEDYLIDEQILHKDVVSFIVIISLVRICVVSALSYLVLFLLSKLFAVIGIASVLDFLLNAITTISFGLISTLDDVAGMISAIIGCNSAIKFLIVQTDIAKNRIEDRRFSAKTIGIIVIVGFLAAAIISVLVNSPFSMLYSSITCYGGWKFLKISHASKKALKQLADTQLEQ